MAEKRIGLLKAMERMRELSHQNVPFSIKYCSLNESDKSTQGLKEEKKILLMQGYRRNQSKKYDILVSFQRMDTDERRQFYMPLLMEFNGIKIKNAKG